MVRALLSLRFLLALASVGAAAGAAIMFWLACVKLFHGASLLWASGAGASGEITAEVMRAIDAFLFGVVLVIFAYAIAFGFALHLTEKVRERIPPWMRVSGVDELKRTLVEVILVYLVVDFATDIAAGEGGAEWALLVKPASILMIAGALRLMAHAGRP